MIRVWNLKVKTISARRLFYTTGIEEENHELIVWKHWIGFYPRTDFFHHIILRHNLYNLMDALLKMGNYSIIQKREDKTHLYSANIVEISPYMLEPMSGLEHHAIQAKLQDLATLGYISFTPSTRGKKATMNILLNEYNKDGIRIFEIDEKTWLTERMRTEKETMYGEFADIRYVGAFNGVAGMQGILSVEDVQVRHIIGDRDGNAVSVEGLQVRPHVDKPVETVDNSAVSVEGLQEHHVNVIPDSTGEIIEKATQKSDAGSQTNYEGLSKDFMSAVENATGYNGDSKPKSADQDEMRRKGEGGTIGGLGVRGVNGIKQVVNKTIQGVTIVTPPKKPSGYRHTANETAVCGEVNVSTLPTSVRIVAMLWKEETNLPVREQDVQYISDSLKISAIPQVVSAIQSAKVWRATLPQNFDTLSEVDKKRKLVESQPGYFLRRMGMKHVFNFLKNSPRYRKDKRRPKTTGVVSGLNRKRVQETQAKRLQEIRAKRKEQNKKPEDQRKGVMQDAGGKR